MAFQAVLLVGSIDVVVPRNVAVAVNYACVECVTQALATQLVVTLPGELSQAGTDELMSVWAELQAFGEQLEGLPLAELRDRLTDFEVRILDVVQRDGAEVEGGPVEDTSTPGDTGTDDGTGHADTDTDTDDPADGSDAAEPTTSAGPTATATRSPTGSTPSTTGSAPSQPAEPTSGTATSDAPDSGSGTATSPGTATPTG